MGFYQFNEAQALDQRLGGKASGLAKLSQLGFQVPRGAVLSEPPRAEDWQTMIQWWKHLGYPPLAIRSSASAEDGLKKSFAGQNQSFLNVHDEESLRLSVQKCFKSSEGESTRAYQNFFETDFQQDSAMNVVLQEMVKPRFSGVFFSRDPRGKKRGWILEVITGLAEDLVSGKLTPGQVLEFGQDTPLPQGFTRQIAEEIAEIAKRIREALKFEVDIEWAYDQNNQIQILQARPITTLCDEKSDRNYIEEELKRLEKTHSEKTHWDGQTFAEWSGFPSYFTFSLWKNAFSPHHAFGDALKLLGYQSYINAPYEPKDSLLERVYGRAYINLDRLTDLYYGPIPYRIVPRPRPHTQFDWRKINLRTILHLPAAISNMLRVSWNLSTKRKFWLNRCSHELNRIKSQMTRPLEKEFYESKSLEDLATILKKETHDFSKQHLLWPLVLVILTESTVQRISLILKQILGSSEGDKKLRDWMGKGLHTVTHQMQKEYQEATLHPSKKAYFLAKYGHRGPGELDLVHPRWNELKDLTFKGSKQRKEVTHQTHDVLQEIRSLQSFKREMVLEEWTLLQQMLELREQWKMEILKPYAQIRVLVNVLSEKLELAENIHWLRLSEVLQLIEEPKRLSPYLKKADDRKNRFKAFKTISFPNFISLKEVRSLIKGETKEDLNSFDGEALSSGVASGEVRIIQDPHLIQLEDWPEDVILVAETTDPGWTPLFARSRAIVVERGGVLSHCAIVAREMQIPAVSGIFRATQFLKDGDRVWVDGNHGRIIRESK